MAIDLVNVAAGAGGFVIHGQDASDLSGYSVSSAGDVNGDGFDDLIIGASGGDGPGNTRAGAGDSYVVFGKASRLRGGDRPRRARGRQRRLRHPWRGRAAITSGCSVSSAGDVNGDGFDDLIIGAHGGDGPGNTAPCAGDSYVVFGKAGGFAAGDRPRRARGRQRRLRHPWRRTANDMSGSSVASAGDVNGDGFDDLIVGAAGATAPTTARASAGESYVVFGKAGGFAAEIDLAAVAAGNGGFVIHGEDAGDYAGDSVASAGDVNGDGFDDLIVGAWSPTAATHAPMRARATWCSARRRALRPTIDLAAVAAGNGGFVHPWRGCGRLLRHLGGLGGRRQRRRLRRPDHRGIRRRRPRQHTRPCRRELCGVRQGRRLCGRDRPRRARGRQRRLRHPVARTRTTTPAARSPRRATSTATASTT